MHEAGVAQSLMEIVLDTAKANDAEKVNKVFVTIGALTAIEKNALEFAYDVVKEDTIAKDSEIIITEVPVTGKCNECGKTHEYDRFVFECASCGSFSVELISGEEMQITEIEVD